MTFLPIVERELRVAARRQWTYALRFLAALCVIALGVTILVGNHRSMAPPYLGQLLFRASSLIGFGLALFSGMFLTADCLCSEKRDGTLGLLFLTDLKGYDVVLGKLAATSIVSVYGLLAIIPIMGLPLLMGGVSPGEFARMILALLDALFLSLAGGMLASALCRDTRDAMLASFAQILFLNGVLLLLAWGADALFKGRSLDVILMLPSPLLSYLRTGDTTAPFQLGFSPYWGSLGIVAGLALLQLFLAMVLLPRSWQQADTQGRWADRGRPRARFLPTQLAHTPFFWLATREPFPGRGRAWTVRLLFVLWWVLFGATLLVPRNRGGDQCLLFAIFIAYGLHFIIKILVATQATHRLGEDLRSGALELLLVTPMEPEQIVEEQKRGLQRQFKVWLRMLWLMNGALFLLFIVVDPMRMPPEIQWTFGLFMVGGALILPVDFDALIWTGMAEALTGQRPHRAVLMTLLRILAPPILFLGLVIFTISGAGASTGGVNVIHLIWFCVGLMTSRWMASSRKALLRQNFRRLASGEQPKRRNDSPSPGLYWVAEPTLPPQTSA